MSRPGNLVCGPAVHSRKFSSGFWYRWSPVTHWSIRRAFSCGVSGEMSVLEWYSVPIMGARLSARSQVKDCMTRWRRERRAGSRLPCCPCTLSRAGMFLKWADLFKSVAMDSWWIQQTDPVCHELPVANNCPARGEASYPLCPLHAGICLAWVCLGLLHATTDTLNFYVQRPCSKTHFPCSDPPPHLHGYYKFSAPSSVMIPQSWEEACDTDVPLGLSAPPSLRVDQVWVTVSVAVYCKRMLLQWRFW